MSAPTDADAREVLRRFGLAAVPAQALGNHGGFSGARIWRAQTNRGDRCLKAWPSAGITSARHREILRLIRIARRAELTFIPITSDCVEHAGRLWDLADWMPGAADFHANPSPARLRSACVALARLHIAWSDFSMPSRPCPAVNRRLTAAREWLDATVAPSFVFFKAVNLRRPRVHAADPVSHWAQRAAEIAEQRIPNIPGLLEPWQSVPLPAQPCLCDVWHDHAFFTGDELTGLIDFGAIKVDNVAVDLARLLGSLVGDDVAQREAGLNAYAEIRPLSEFERALVPVLDRTGVVLGLANWLRRLWQHGTEYENRAAVADRLASLVRRIENW